MKAFLFNLIIRLTSLFNLNTNRKIAKGLANLVWLLSKKIKHTTQTNINKCFPELSQEQKATLAKTSFQNTLMSFFELGPLWKKASNIDDLIENVYGLEEFENNINQEQGMFLAVPHHGSWEVLNLLLARFKGYAFLFKPPTDPKLKESLVKFRGKSNAVQIEADRKGVRKLLNHVKGNGFVAILPDQKPKSGQGTFAPFFNQPTYTMTLFSRLAAKTKVPVFFVYAERTKKGFDVHFEKASEQIYSPMQESVEYMNLAIEKIVRQTPEQYQWTYRRFSIQPEGSENFYK